MPDWDLALPARGGSEIKMQCVGTATIYKSGCWHGKTGEENSKMAKRV